MKPLMLAAAMAMAVLGCSDGGQTEYSGQTRIDFMAACTDPVTDVDRTIDLCECVYRNARSQLPYAELEAYATELAADPSAALPETLNVVVADCVIEVAGL